MKRIIPFYHDLIKDILTKDDIAIDATMGNGNDTLLLCSLAKFVYAYDIQKEALKNTEVLLKEHQLSNVSLLHESHEAISDLKETVKVVTFNLGYLPGSDKKIKTVPSSTLKALQASLSLLDKTGIIVLTIYTGHDGGREEATVIEEYTRKLSSKEFNVLRYEFTNKRNAPYLILIQKI